MSVFYNPLYNMATGDLTQSQINELQLQESQSLTAAGAVPADAESQATSDVNAAVDTFSGTGGLGLTWAGAQPGAGPFAAIGTDISNAANAIASNWYLIIGAVLLFILVAVWAYGGFR